MSKNSNIPKLFRDIFKNAYLPYKDPETLKLFLKSINDFTYDHSEKLGDAFEYLLSVLGSQGDAGQFRTPRHIIDFIVSIVDPKKDETVLDPACGTAGFLISAYKHILAENTKKMPGDKLTPSERKQLLTNFSGYDISPDMVRLSLVNLYLHGFVQPQIYEYDTLTSEDRWKEYADVIMANPPFMSPSGGIRPHKKFSIQSNRSEVLFVDYMVEHLNPKGRAGIIVPEGIIFQGGTAYKALRKTLVEKYLVAVISLPAGVFNPYSGVKTSILILDASIAQDTKTIAFLKVENDGYGLGAQRKEITENDLPKLEKELADYLEKIRNKKSVDNFKISSGLIVPKEKISANGEYNFSGDKYRDSIKKSSDFPQVELGSVCEILNGYAFKSENYVDKGIRIIRITNVQKGKIVDDNPKFYPTNNKERIEKYNLYEDDLLISLTGNVGRVGLFPKDLLPAALNQRVACLRVNDNKIDVKYLFELLNEDYFEDECIKASSGIAQKNLSTVWLSRYKIPLPPIDIQKEIVAEIGSYQKVIDGARAVIENYRPQIPIDPEWQIVELGEVCKPEYGFTETALDKGDARFVRITDISREGLLIPDDNKYIKLTAEAKKYLLEKGDVLVARTGATFGKTMIFDEDYKAVFASFLIRLRFPSNKVNPRFYWAFAQSDAYWNQAKTLMTGGGQPQFNGNALIKIKIHIPSIEVQQKIVSEIEVEQALVASNKNLIERFEKKIQETIARIWKE
jgi:type I restriction enzyme M protein